MSNKRYHIAVIRLSAMGDVAMTVPVIRALVQQHENVEVTIVSRPFFKPFFVDIPQVNFFAVDLIQRHKGFFGLLLLFFDLKKRKVDAVADLHNVLRSKVIRALFLISGRKVAHTDKGRKEKKQLTRLEDKTLFYTKTMFERHLDTLDSLGFKVNLINPIFPEKKQVSSEVIRKLNEISNFTEEQEKKIGIAPFAQYESKVYPLDLLQEVFEDLAKKANFVLYLFGGGTNEIENLYKLKGDHENVVVVAGKLNLKEELELISNLDVMLSMDSGNGHIAAMLGVKVITVWGATHPCLGFQPFNQPIERSISPDRNRFPFLPTSVYGNKEVKGYEDVMRSITPNEIILKIQEVIK